MVMNIKDLKPGNAYIEDNELYLCISNQQQGRLFVKYNVKKKKYENWFNHRKYISFKC